MYPAFTQIIDGVICDIVRATPALKGFPKSIQAAAMKHLLSNDSSQYLGKFAPLSDVHKWLELPRPSRERHVKEHFDMLLHYSSEQRGVMARFCPKCGAAGLKHNHCPYCHRVFTVLERER